MAKEKTRHFYIESLIHDRSEKSYVGPEPTAKNYKQWEENWLRSAEELKQEFISEGLMKSALYVDETIAINSSTPYFKIRVRE